MAPSNDPEVREPARLRHRRPALALAAVLAVAGLALIGSAGYGQQGPPPSPEAAAPVVSRPGAAPSAPPETPTGVSRAQVSAPASLRIPAIEVSSPVNSVGLNPDRTMQVPTPGPRYDQAAWYRFSPMPGELGPSVIIGHVDSATGGPSVFYQVGTLKPGERIEVTRVDRSTATFAVDAVRSYPKDAFPQQTVYGDTTSPELRLITCSGSFDTSARSYRHNTVVFASQVS